jgi:large subunit ribosomal protein L18
MATAHNIKAARRAKRVRFKLKQTATTSLRLSVHRSNNNIYAQIIDDSASKTLVAASSLEKGFDRAGKTGLTVDIARKVGVVLAEKAKKAALGKVYFDRGQYIYHGRIKALAEGAREGGLEF